MAQTNRPDPFDNLLGYQSDSLREYIANNPGLTKQRVDVEVAFRYAFRQGFTKAVELMENAAGCPGNKETASYAAIAMHAIIGNSSMMDYCAQSSRHLYENKDLFNSVADRSVQFAEALVARLSQPRKPDPDHA